MEFNNKEPAHFTDYKIKDTISFQSNFGDIDTINWTDKFGLTAYRTKDGEIWTKESSR